MRRAKPRSNRYCAILLSALCGCAAASEEAGVEGLAQVEGDPDETPPSTEPADAMDAGSPPAADAATPPPVDAGPPPPPPNVVKLKDATGAEVAEIIGSGKVVGLTFTAPPELLEVLNGLAAAHHLGEPGGIKK